MVTRWELFDPEEPETYTLQMNPAEGVAPGIRKNIQYEGTLAGRTLIFEGQDQPQQITWNQVALTIADRDILLAWVDKRRQIMVTTDLGEEIWLYFTGIEFTRKRVTNHEVRYEYTISATVLDWPTG
jgi:hypothetical protein